MEGLELRKAVLMAAGWTEKPHTDKWCNLHDEKGEFYVGGSGNVWDDAPPVESSVDAALEWLTLGEGHYWQLDGPVSGPDTQGSSLANIVDINSSMERVTVGNPATPEEMKTAIKFNKPLAEADAETMSAAMCKAYLEYKQRG